MAILTRARAGTVARTGAGAPLVAAVLEECRRVVAAEGHPPPEDVVAIVRGLYAQRDSGTTPPSLWTWRRTD